MKIALVSPRAESVSSGLYGGTECVVSYLTDERSADSTRRAPPCAHPFDVLHFHTEPLPHFPLFRAHRWQATVYHGLSQDVCPLNPAAEAVARTALLRVHRAAACPKDDRDL